jgi:hypothetical protein
MTNSSSGVVPVGAHDHRPRIYRPPGLLVASLQKRPALRFVLKKEKVCSDE